MLIVSMDEGKEVLCVQETLYTFRSDIIRFWYFNLVTCMKSSTGRAGGKIDRPMNAEDLSWVRKHYLPKVQDQLTPKQYAVLAGGEQ